jgi:hypothetical protein
VSDGVGELDPQVEPPERGDATLERSSPPTRTVWGASWTVTRGRSAGDDEG